MQWSLVDLGNIALNLSLIIYLVWFIPQIVLNFKRKNTEGLSFWMYGLLTMGYLTDLLYGFGREMEWQYRLVTMVGLISLAVQHYQFWRYAGLTAWKRSAHALLNGSYGFLFLYALWALYERPYGQNFYVSAGIIANICWFIYSLPQILKNYYHQSTVGLSVAFVWLAILLKLCDITSAFSLDWDYPSKVGAVATLGLSLILLFQVRRYRQA